jgi:hypothetical protein
MQYESRNAPMAHNEESRSGRERCPTHFLNRFRTIDSLK